MMSNSIEFVMTHVLPIHIKQYKKQKESMKWQKANHYKIRFLIL